MDAKALPQPLTSLEASITYNDKGILDSVFGQEATLGRKSCTMMIQAFLDYFPKSSISEYATLITFWDKNPVAVFNVGQDGSMDVQLTDGKQQHYTLSAKPSQSLLGPTWVTLVQDVEANKYTLYIGTTQVAEGIVEKGWVFPKDLTPGFEEKNAINGEIGLVQIYQNALSKDEIAGIIHHHDQKGKAQHEKTRELRAAAKTGVRRLD